MSGKEVGEGENQGPEQGGASSEGRRPPASGAAAHRRGGTCVSARPAGPSRGPIGLLLDSLEPVQDRRDPEKALHSRDTGPCRTSQRKQFPSTSEGTLSPQKCVSYTVEYHSATEKDEPESLIGKRVQLETGEMTQTQTPRGFSYGRNTTAVISAGVEPGAWPLSSWRSPGCRRRRGVRVPVPLLKQEPP